MANQRSKDKAQVNARLTKADADLLRATGKKLGYKDLPEFLQAVARGAVKVSPQVKALCLLAAPAGVGCLIWIIPIIGGFTMAAKALMAFM